MLTMVSGSRATIETAMRRRGWRRLVHGADRRAKRPSGKVHFRGGGVDRFGSGATAEARPRGDRVAGRAARAELRDAIRNGRLGPASGFPRRAPSPASWACHAGSSSTCYAQLQAEGYLSSRAPGRRPASRRRSPRRRRRPPPRPRRPPRLRLRPGVPDLGRFPRADWLWALAEVAAARLARGVATATRAAARCCATSSPPTSAASAASVVDRADRRLRRLRPGHQAGAAPWPPDGVRADRRRGPRRDATSDASPRRAASAPSGAGRRAGHRRRGAARPARARAVARSPRRTSAPTGGVLAPERRQALVAWANERVAANHRGRLRRRVPLRPRAGRRAAGARPGAGRAIGTVSKSLAPALRLGWIVCPPGSPSSGADKALTDRGSPGLDQLALAELIGSGRYDRHLRRMRRVYAARREALCRRARASRSRRRAGRPRRRLPRRRPPACRRRRGRVVARGPSARSACTA